MDLQLKDKNFLVCGASSGFGLAIAETLLGEGAHVIAVARNQENLQKHFQAAGSRVQLIIADVTDISTHAQILDALADKELHGVVINAGGPPAKTFMETSLEDWDNAYKNLLRWKFALTKSLVPKLIKQGYGRILYIESASVKQPIENLVLSSSLRVAVVGMVKTLSQEIATTGVTLNILGPGSHDTPAIDRIYHKKSEQTGLPFSEVKEKAIQQIPVGKLGTAADFASLAVWLLSPLSGYITGQTITVDGGSIKGML